MSDHTAQMTGLGAGYGNALLRAHERIAELEAEVARLRQYQRDETGWLIEHEDEPKWLTLRPPEAIWSVYWTKESTEALRFCRRSDAEDYAAAFMDDGPIRITEHIWTAPRQALKGPDHDPHHRRPPRRGVPHV